MPDSPNSSSSSNDDNSAPPDSQPPLPSSGSALGLSFASENSTEPAPTPGQAPGAPLSELSPIPADPAPRLAKQAHFSDLTQIRTISPVPQRRHSYHQPSAPAEPAPAPPPRDSPPRRPSLTQTHSDLRTLLKSFLLLVPPALRRLRFLIPSPLRVIARFVIRYVAMFLHARGALGSNLVYDVVAHMWRIVITIFFREIRSRGAWKIPRSSEGAVIFVVGPHHNQFLDPLLLMSEVKRESGRRISFLAAAKSMDRAFVGLASRLMQSIPVARAQDYAFAGQGTISLSPSDPLTILGTGTNFTKDFSKPRSQLLLPRNLGSSTAEVVEVVSDTELKLKKEFSKKALDALKEREDGVAFKVLPHVDQSSMYSAVYQKLIDGGCIGIFPEGGSHDRTDLLPLKAGVSIMALGAKSAHPDLKLQIVPVGLSYFHPHKFRSRAVVEFGSPIEIPQDYVSEFEKGGEDKKKAIGEVMELIVDGLKSVTIRAPDYETLMLIQAARRLYRPPGTNLTIGQVVELNKRFIVGYEVYKDDPRIKELERGVREYNTLLRYMGLKDHQVESVGRPRWRSFFLLCYRLGLLSVWGVLALPGVVLNAPIFFAAKLISRAKAKEALAASTVKIAGRDVLATWKVLVALAGAPSLYTIYAINAVVLAHKLGLPYKYKLAAPFATFAGLPFIGVAALKFGEVGMDVYKSMRPLLLSLIPGKEPELKRLRHMRETLASELNELVDELAPTVFEDFDSRRIIPSTDVGVRRESAQGKFLQHPLNWVDELLFGSGWSQSMAHPADRKVKSMLPETSGMESDMDGGFTDGQAGGSGYASGYTTEDAPDYDEVIHILNREQGRPDSPLPSPRPGLYRRASRQRSRSQLNLAGMSPVTPTTSLAASTSLQDGGEATARRRTRQGSGDAQE
ncbi:Glycerol-3-phosphate/dihydroxyacetone phosphate acyltransferase [Rhodotorula toruloides]